MLTAGQIRAARALLRWSLAELEERSAVCSYIVEFIENSDALTASDETYLSLLKTFNENGIIFYPEIAGNTPKPGSPDLLDGEGAAYAYQSGFIREIARQLRERKKYWDVSGNIESGIVDKALVSLLKQIGEYEFEKGVGWFLMMNRTVNLPYFDHENRVSGFLLDISERNFNLLINDALSDGEIEPEEQILLSRKVVHQGFWKPVEYYSDVL